MAPSEFDWRSLFCRGVVIPAHPLALTAERKFDERHQRALTRYYMAAGVGGIAVGVHTTQFAIRNPHIGLYEPVLALAAETLGASKVVRIAGICGKTKQATVEAAIAQRHGYHAALLSLAAMAGASTSELLDHVRVVGEVMPIIGFYLQPAVGGQMLPVEFWREFAKIESVIGIKIAPFNRYATQDVLRGVAESGRADQVTLYTGNDDNIVLDLLSEHRFSGHSLRMRGGLLGHWAVWTERAVAIHGEIQSVVASQQSLDPMWLTRNGEVTDMNAAIFDVANDFHGCIAGIHEVLRRQGLMAGRWCLDPNEELSRGQMEEIDRVTAAYPHLVDNAFIQEHLDSWLV
jgi:dihydrodipicolinate synthase/N-acetylneuraminate lyase